MIPLSLLQQRIRLIFWTAVTLCFFTSLQASEPAHEHGVGHLSIAIQGDEVEIELVVPGADAVGFEHTAKTESEKRAVKVAAEKLKEAKRLITLTPVAHCHLEETKVTSALLQSDKDEHNHTKDHTHLKHVKNGEHKQDEHDHKGHEKHGHKDLEKHAGSEVHSEFSAHYHFHCDHPEKLIGADVGFFKVFPSAHGLETRWVTDKGQGTIELTAKASRLTF